MTDQKFREPEKPALVFVPGAWHSPDAYQDVISLLSIFNYESHKVFLPSVGVTPGISSFQPDVDALRGKISELVEQGKDVIVILHSYGGMVGTEAVTEELTKKVREANGKQGGVVRLLYIMAYALPVGSSVQGFHVSEAAAKREGQSNAMLWDIDVSLAPLGSLIS